MVVVLLLLALRCRRAECCCRLLLQTLSCLLQVQREAVDKRDLVVLAHITGGA